MIKSLSLTFLVMVISMSVYETLKQLINPGITIWESHITTITVSTLAATIAAYYLFKKYDKLHHIALHEIAERKRAQELLAEGYDELEKRIQNRTAELTESNGRLKEEIVHSKQVETDLRRSEERFSKVFHNAPVAIGIINAEEGRFLMVNDSFIQLMECDDKDQVHGKTLDELDLWADEFDWNSIVEELDKTTGKTFIKQTRVRTLLGEIRNVFFSAEKINLIGSSCILGMFLDISDQIKAEKALLEAKEHAEEMDRFKTSLLAILSNEVRKPLYEIVRSSSQVIQSIQDQQTQKMVYNIQRDSDQLLETITSILDLAKVESDKSKLELTLCDLEQEIASAVYPLREDARNKHIELQIIVKEGNLKVYLDKTFFQHIITNLVSNAIKFTDQGNVSITIDRKEGNNNFWAYFQVKDTGIGIGQDLLPYLFEPVKPDDQILEKIHYTTWLGLPVTKRMINLMNGDISVESVLGEGSCFTVRFPKIVDASQRKKQSQQLNHQVF